METIVIIGNGRFGKYLSSQIQDRADYRIFSFEKGEKPPKHAMPKADFLFFCVPIACFQQSFADFLPFINPECVVMDTCSVKAWPCYLAGRSLIAKQFVGSHPLFGPQSAPKTCAGHRVALCQHEAEGDIYLSALYFWRKIMECLVVPVTPLEHDKYMASQIVNHILGRVGNELGLQRVALSTKTHDLWMDIQDIVMGNSNELFSDMNHYNPYGRQIRDGLKLAVKNMCEDLDQGDIAEIKKLTNPKSWL